MINYDDVTKENMNEHNPDWPQVSNHPYKIIIIIIPVPRSGKTDAFLNSIKKQNDDN